MNDVMDRTEARTIAAAEKSPSRGPGRRAHERKRLVYRLVTVEHDGDQGLARCRNISESGLKLEVTMPVTIGARMSVAFSAVHVFDGVVIWAKDGFCGVALEEPIDYDLMLRQSAAETRSHGFPGLKPNHGLWATLSCDGSTRETRVAEVTQHGLMLAHDGKIRSNVRLSVRFGHGRERQGIVRWSRNHVADVVLFEPFSVGELGSVAALASTVIRDWSRA